MNQLVPDQLRELWQRVDLREMTAEGFRAALILDSRGVELRMMYTDDIPVHDP